MTFAVTLLLDPQNPISVSLDLSHEPDLCFTFADEDGEKIIHDPVTCFDQVQFLDDVIRHVIFSGSSVTRSIIFDTDADYKRFFELLLSEVTLSPQESDPKLISIVHKQTSQRVFGKVGAVMNYITGHVDPPPQRPADAIVKKIIDSTFPVRKIVPFDRDNAMKSNLDGVNFSRFDVAEDAWPIIFNRLLNVKPSDDYVNLTRQWKLTSMEQWRRHLLMRKFVHGLDNWLAQSQLPTRYHKQLFFNVMMASFTERFSTLELNHGTLTICDQICRLFLSPSADDGTFTLKTGETLSQFETEKFIFGHVKAILMKMDGIPNPKQEFPAILTYLNGLSPSTALMLEERNLDLMDFAQNYCDLFFSQGKVQTDCWMLIAWALCNQDLATFRKEVLCTALILTEEKLQRIPINDVDQFKACFATELAMIPARLLIWNSWKLQNS